MALCQHEARIERERERVQRELAARRPKRPKLTRQQQLDLERAESRERLAVRMRATEAAIAAVELEPVSAAELGAVLSAIGLVDHDERWTLAPKGGQR
ncbi:hypothetical protein [Botrimarina hoheduenensis]|uniref:Uncharacterized protein n=1 Tax=Botrimarina hoheduenensis TaxID=2528000 RepID=A0A5C5WD20_9BACT|nr:hypothetical protein [Botrimarina hoheduenensis]TWT48387.1 hypothetical protein Pla111_01530 [Botrimarina hoheduenensis]